MRIEYSEKPHTEHVHPFSRKFVDAYIKIKDIAHQTDAEDHFLLTIEWQAHKVFYEKSNTHGIELSVNSFSFNVQSIAGTTTKTLFHTLKKEFTAGKFADFTKSKDREKAGLHLLGFLFLQPGDTDAEYFEKFNKAEMDFILKYGPEINMILQGKLNE